MGNVPHVDDAALCRSLSVGLIGSTGFKKGTDRG